MCLYKMDVKKGLLLAVCSDLLAVNLQKSILIPMEKLFRLRISSHNTRNLGYFNLQVRELNELLARRLCFFSKWMFKPYSLQMIPQVISALLFHGVIAAYISQH